MRHLFDWISETEEKCVDCGLCVKSCDFLGRYGSPKFLAGHCGSSDQGCHDFAFECSLCDLCNAVCPNAVTPSRLFMELRRSCARRGLGISRNHETLLNFEKRGTSRRYTLYALPRGCKSILFPGCALAGSRPNQVFRLLRHLRETCPSMGIVLDCCTKPSHDLGREEHFHAIFHAMRHTLLVHGVHTVITACPGCHAIFKAYGGELKVTSVYEILTEIQPLAGQRVSGVVTVHDPCTCRFETSVQSAVRSLARGRGLDIEEMAASREMTVCCGEGGAVHFLNTELAGKWRTKRREQAGDRRVLCYCAGCAGFLGSQVSTTHILDLIMEPQAAMAGKAKVSRAPWTYLNRILLKKRLKQWMPDAFVYERPDSSTIHR